MTRSSFRSHAPPATVFTSGCGKEPGINWVSNRLINPKTHLAATEHPVKNTAPEGLFAGVAVTFDAVKTR